jgi:hypothetical protein
MERCGAARCRVRTQHPISPVLATRLLAREHRAHPASVRLAYRNTSGQEAQLVTVPVGKPRRSSTPIWCVRERPGASGGRALALIDAPTARAPRDAFMPRCRKRASASRGTFGRSRGTLPSAPVPVLGTRGSRWIRVFGRAASNRAQRTAHKPTASPRMLRPDLCSPARSTPDSTG